MISLNRENLYKKNVLVVGLGVSGFWSALWMANQGAEVTITDVKQEEEIDSSLLKGISGAGIRLEAGGHREDTFRSAEIIVISPGVSSDVPLLQQAEKNGTYVTGELELASRLIDTPMIAVTGTNGKSTVTALLGAMLKGAGFRVFVGGNIGTPLMAYVAGEKEADYVVVEVSSFQLDTVETFCPYVSVLLNVTADHLDRHGNFEAYAQTKLKIFKNQNKGQYIVLNDDDSLLCQVTPPPGSRVLRYGLEEKKGRDAFIRDGKIMVSLGDTERRTIDALPYRLIGDHNLQNLMAGVLAGAALGIETRAIERTISEFKGLPNRLERVREVGSVVFYNDSKATNVEAAVNAIMSFDRPIVLIAGGRNKGADFRPLAKAAAGCVRQAVFMGESKELLAEAFQGVAPFTYAENMEDAVRIGFYCAVPGDAVVLAPACASFDMYSDYSHRGQEFRTAVEKVVGGGN